MQIESIETFPTTMRLVSPIPMSSGVISSTQNVVVKLRTDEGHVGWGEGVEAPALTGQRQSDILSDIESLRSVVIGSDPMRRNQLWASMTALAPNATTAIGAVDIAVHDLVGRALGVPIHQLIGGASRDRVPALALVGSGDASADTAKLAERYEQGYRWFKVKLGMGPADVELGTIATALEMVGTDGVVCGDANEAWSSEQAAEFLEQLRGTSVRFIEQPIARDEPTDLIRLAEASPVALCADEGAGTLESIVEYGLSAVGGVSLKLIKHGGITGVMRGAAISASSGLEVNLAGKVIESSISAAANLQCAAAMDRLDYGCSPGNQGVALDVSPNPITVSNGEYLVPSGPGLGLHVDEALVSELAS